MNRSAQTTPRSGGSAAASDRTAASRAVARVATWGVIVSIALMALTVVIAVFSHSLALVAMAVDSIVDAVAALVLWLGLRLSERKTAAFPSASTRSRTCCRWQSHCSSSSLPTRSPDKRSRPAGRRRASTGWSSPASSSRSWPPGRTGWYAMRVGERVSSPALVADGKHRQIDVLSTALALVAVVSTYAGFDIDRVAAVVILAFAVYAGWGLLVAGMKVLLDASVDAAMLTQIRRMLESEPLVSQVDSLAARSAGRYLFLEATLRLRTDDLAKAHAASERLEAQIREAIPAMERVSLHIEPRRREILHVAVPLASPGGEISGEFGEASCFGLAQVHAANGRVLRQEVLLTPSSAPRSRRGSSWPSGSSVKASMC